jgi:small conductance mechanosensitive channel
MSLIMSKVISFLLMLALLFLILGILHLDQLLTSLLATAGVLGLAIGLALQEPLSNAFSGIMLSIKQRFNAGDLIESNGHFGTIKEVNLRSTIMHVPSGQVVTIPNKMVLQNPIVNYSYLGRRRVELDCGISYGEDLDFVEQVAREALVDVVKLEDFEVDFLYTSFGDSSINFRVRFWIDQLAQGEFLFMKSQALRAIKKAFDKNNILIPFPIRTIDFAIKGGSTLAQQLTHNSVSDPENGRD